ncbi:uncharacterized protein LOC142348695 isoform X2 [Convolutriloba macropyga]|uniref:uncharacterized protein LOC142348695 isoform X2 n=1 Tax=Convolutriloba macropyga TaxID=536237 RepID=UPI003F51C88F
MNKEKSKGILRQWQDLSSLKISDSESVKANRRRLCQASSESRNNVKSEQTSGDFSFSQQELKCSDTKLTCAFPFNIKSEPSELSEKMTYAEKLFGGSARIATAMEVNRTRRELLSSCSKSRHLFKAPRVSNNCQMSEKSVVDVKIEAPVSDANVTVQFPEGEDKKNKRPYNERLFGCAASIMCLDQVKRRRSDALSSSKRHNFTTPFKVDGTQYDGNLQSCPPVKSEFDPRQVDADRNSLIEVNTNVVNGIEIARPPKRSYDHVGTAKTPRGADSAKPEEEEESGSKSKSEVKLWEQETKAEANKIICSLLGGVSTAKVFHDANKFEDAGWISDFDDKEESMRGKRVRGSKRSLDLRRSKVSASSSKPSCAGQSRRSLASSYSKVSKTKRSRRLQTGAGAEADDLTYSALSVENLLLKTDEEQQRIGVSQDIEDKILSQNDSKTRLKTDAHSFDNPLNAEKNDDVEKKTGKVNLRSSLHDSVCALDAFQFTERSEGQVSDTNNGDNNRKDLDEEEKTPNCNEVVDHEPNSRQDFMDVSFLSDSFYLPLNSPPAEPELNIDVGKREIDFAEEVSVVIPGPQFTFHLESCMPNCSSLGGENENRLKPSTSTLDLSSDGLKSTKSDFEKSEQILLRDASSVFKPPRVTNKLEQLSETNANKLRSKLEPNSLSLRELLCLDASIGKNLGHLQSSYKIGCGVEFTFEKYRNSLLNQARCLSILAILPHYHRFLKICSTQQRLRERIDMNKLTQSGFILFSDTKLSSASVQHAKIVGEKSKYKKETDTFYAQVQMNKCSQSQFSRNDVWLILATSYMLPSDSQPLLARSIMPWPLWNGQLQLQVISSPPNLDLRLFVKSNRSATLVKLASSVHDLDSLQFIANNLSDPANDKSSVVRNLLKVRREKGCGMTGDDVNANKEIIKPPLVKDEFRETVFSLAEEFEAVFGLNEQQKSALNKLCDSICSKEREGTDAVMLIHGVFGSGKSFLLAVFVHFLTTLSYANAFKNDDNECQKSDSNFSIVVCSGTNVAVDNVLMKYSELVHNAVRLYLEQENWPAESREEELSIRVDKLLSRDLLRIGNVQKISKSLLKYSLHQDVETDNLKLLTRRLKDKELPLRERESLLSDRRREKRSARSDRVKLARVIGVTSAACLSSYLNNTPVTSNNPYKCTFLIVDEATQMTESTSLLAISRFKPTLLLLVGDPNQLPPVIPDVQFTTSESSAFVQPENGHHIMKAEETSLFTRLHRNGFKPLMLNTQYRCHPAIAHLNNQLFYHSTLTNGVTEEQRSAIVCCNSDKEASSLTLKPQLSEGAKLAPVTMVNVDKGCEMSWKSTSSSGYRENSAGREGSRGGSLYNPVEAKLCVDIVVSLLQKQNIAAQDIGVICFYKDQANLVHEELVRALEATENYNNSLWIEVVTETERNEPKMRHCIDDRISSKSSWTIPKVSTVDAFQGAEKEIILLCTTKTIDQQNSYTEQSFFSNPFRLNVAISRAKRHLIILCHLPFILKLVNNPNSSTNLRYDWQELYNMIGDSGQHYCLLNASKFRETMYID